MAMSIQIFHDFGKKNVTRLLTPKWSNEDSIKIKNIRVILSCANDVLAPTLHNSMKH